MSTPFFFDRQWAVTLSEPNTAFGKTYSQLKVSFDIDKNSQSTSNKAKVDIWNLNEQSRQLYQKGAQLRLDAGYKNLVETLYIGDTTQNGVRSKRSGADIIMSFECGANQKQLSSAVYDQSYPPGFPLVEILQDLANNGLGIPIGRVLGIPNFTYNSCLAVSGWVKDSLDKLLAPFDLEWFIDNNSLNILPKSAHLGNPAIVVSSGTTLRNPIANLGPLAATDINSFVSASNQNTGLIGAPSQGDGFVEFISLLNPKLNPGTLVQLLSETITGYFRIRRSHFEGDSHGDKWQVTCEAVRINATQNLSSNVGSKFKT